MFQWLVNCPFKKVNSKLWFHVECTLNVTSNCSDSTIASLNTLRLQHRNSCKQTHFLSTSVNKRAKRQMAFPFGKSRAPSARRGPKHGENALKPVASPHEPIRWGFLKTTRFWKDVVVLIPVIICWVLRAGDLRGGWHHYWSRSPSIHQWETGLESHAGPKAHAYTRPVTDLSIYNPSNSGAAPVSRLPLLSLWAALCSAVKAVYLPEGATDQCLPISIRYVFP